MAESNVELVDFDQIKEMACLSYTSPKGKPTSMWIHVDTFRKIFSNSWDNNVDGEMRTDQHDIKAKILATIKGDPIKWLDKQANTMMMQKVKQSNSNRAEKNDRSK